jgi:putative transposase
MRPYRRLAVKLKKADQRRITELLRRGTPPVRVVRRAQALRLLGMGQTPSQVGPSIGLNAKTVREIGWRYGEQGLERALFERPRPGAAPRFSAAQRQQIIAMVCTPAPAGRERWTVRLIAEEAVKRKLVPRIGRESVRVLLENHELKPWREKNVVRSGTRRTVHRQDGRRAGGL